LLWRAIDSQENDSELRHYDAVNLAYADSRFRYNDQVPRQVGLQECREVLPYESQHGASTGHF
jgi:hypothetical protein